MPISINPRYAYFTKAPINYHNTKFFTTVSDPQMIPGANSPITFVIQSDTNYINFAESYLRFKIKLTLADGNNLPDAIDNHQCFMPNTFHSVFSQVRVRVNDYLVSPSSDLYAYKAYIEELFAQTADTKHLETFTNFKLDIGAQNAFGAAANPNFLERAALSNRSRLIELSGQLNVDFLKNSRNILPGTKIEITLFPQPAPFVIQHDGDEAVAAINFGYRTSEHQYFIRREEINPATALAIEGRLAKEAAVMCYPFSALRGFHLANGIFGYNVDDVWSNQMPTKMIVCFVPTPNFNGSYATNPFWFNPTEAIESVEFFKNSVRSGLQRTCEIDITAHSHNRHTGYRELMNTLYGGSTATQGLPFSLDDWTRGYHFVAIDLTPDGDDAGSHRYPVEQGALSVRVKFREALAAPLQMLIYSQFQETLSINRSRGVTTTISI